MSNILLTASGASVIYFLAHTDHSGNRMEEKNMTGRARRTSKLLGRLRRSSALRLVRVFRRDEGGVLALPLIMFILTMLAIGGVGMDLVHLERDRTVLQYTLDRAVLAAGDLDQTSDARVVVKDYLTKSGLEEYYSDDIVTTVEKTAGSGDDARVTSRRVTANVTSQFDPLWLKFSHYEDTLPLMARSTAEESIGAIEISLVLDVSASMRNNNRLSNLKIAAKEFIETMDENTEEDKLSISIVPYSSQVSVPEAFMNELNTTGENEHSYCLNFEGSDYNTTSLSLTKTHERTMHFNRWGWSDPRRYGGKLSSPECASADRRTSLLFEDDVNTLTNYIDNFQVDANTSIDVGMKWGVTFLDPSIQPAIEAMSKNAPADIDPKFADRPVAYNSTQTLKVVVLMTDGDNTYQAQINPGYRTGPSGVFYNPNEKVYSTLDTRGTPDPDDDQYYWHHTQEFHDHAYGDGTTITEEFICTDWGRRGCRSGYTETKVATENGPAVPLTYAQLFAQTDLQYIYNTLYSQWMDYWEARQKWYYDAMSTIGPDKKDPRTRSICQAAKDQGIVVFTIGFEAPWRGQQVLKDCASSINHYYDVDGLEIRDAFASIAAAIRQLRLTE